MRHLLTEIGSMNFIFINVILVVVLLLYFLSGRSTPKPSKLNLSAKKKLDAVTHKNDEEMRSLTVYFQYNGETKEAYDILGVPAGASLKMAEEAYQKIIEEKTQVDDLCLNAIEAVRRAYQS